MTQGTIIRVAGPVVDVQFTEGKLPALQEALTVTAEGTERTMEVTQHVNETTVRCIMLSASEGLGKGMTVNALGHGLTAPVGEATLGRMFDPLGRPIDGGPEILPDRRVIGIFDLDKCSYGKRTREYLAAAEKEGVVLDVSGEIPKSFVVCDHPYHCLLYTSDAADE